MKTLQLDAFESSRARDEGIERAKSHADVVDPGWSERAYRMFTDWLSGWAKDYCFTIEQFRQSAEIRGLERPPSNRAYGSIAVRAKKEGLIKTERTVKVINKLAHRANAALWQKI